MKKTKNNNELKMKNIKNKEESKMSKESRKIESFNGGKKFEFEQGGYENRKLEEWEIENYIAESESAYEREFNLSGMDYIGKLYENELDRIAFLLNIELNELKGYVKGEKEVLQQHLIKLTRCASKLTSIIYK